MDPRAFPSLLASDATDSHAHSSSSTASDHARPDCSRVHLQTEATLVSNSGSGLILPTSDSLSGLTSSTSVVSAERGAFEALEFEYAAFRASCDASGLCTNSSAPAPSMTLNGFANEPLLPAAPTIPSHQRVARPASATSTNQYIPSAALLSTLEDLLQDSQTSDSPAVPANEVFKRIRAEAVRSGAIQKKRGGRLSFMSAMSDLSRMHQLEKMSRRDASANSESVVPAASSSRAVDTTSSASGPLPKAPDGVPDWMADLEPLPVRMAESIPAEVLALAKAGKKMRGLDTRQWLSPPRKNVHGPGGPGSEYARSRWATLDYDATRPNGVAHHQAREDVLYTWTCALEDADSKLKWQDHWTEALVEKWATYYLRWRFAATPTTSSVTVLGWLNYLVQCIASLTKDARQVKTGLPLLSERGLYNKLEEEVTEIIFKNKLDRTGEDAWDVIRAEGLSMIEKAMKVYNTPRAA